MPKSSFVAAALTGMVLAALPVGSAAADEFTLAAGAGFRRPIGEVAAAYQAASGHEVLQIYGHLGQVFAQARESGQVSLVCGDRTALDAAPGLSFTHTARLGLGRLVIAYRKGLTLKEPGDIAKADIERIGIPDQAQAIYGKAGRQFLDRTGLAANVDAKLVAVATVPQVTSYVACGEIDAGFVNATEAIGAAANIGGHVEVGAAFYDAVEVVCAIPSSAKNPVAAQGFAGFLEADAARAILQRHGL
jgi:molybdate transport system substrate-binding protein